MIVSIHVAAGGLALILGTAALVAKKGGAVHRRSGLVFVGAMLLMAVTGAILGNTGGAAMTIYFVVTAFTTVQPATPWTRRLDVAAVTVPAVLGLLGIAAGVKAFNSPRGVLDGVPFAMHFFLATVMILAAAGDLRVLRRGALRGGPRLARHLWRMCFSLFIAAGSFFSIRERVATVLPEPLTTAPMRTLPILLLLGAMVYWLWRVRGRRRLPDLIRHDSNPD